MPWFCVTCGENHPDRFAFCPVSGYECPQGDRESVGDGSNLEAPKVLHLAARRFVTSERIIRYLEDVLTDARSNRVTFIAMSHGLVGTDAPIMHYWLRDSATDVCAAVAGSFGLAQGILLSNTNIHR